MKKFRCVSIIMSLMVLSDSIVAEEEDWKNYNENIRVESVMQKYKTGQALKDLAGIDDSYSRFLSLLKEFYLVQDAVMQCKDYHSLTVGYAEPGGKRVLAGAAPEQVADLELRKKYIERISQNENNWKISTDLLKIKGEILKMLRESIDSLKEVDRENAKKIVEHLPA